MGVIFSARIPWGAGGRKKIFQGKADEVKEHYHALFKVG
jgi:hypothetical protein